MMRPYTTLTSILLLLPFLVFIVILKGPNKTEISESDIKNSISISSRSSISEIAQLIGSSSCKCDCDISSTGILEATTTPLATYQNEADYEFGTNDNAVNIRSNTESKSTNPIIFVITPTYTRPTQMPDMTRLAQTLMLVKDVFWIVVEDAHVKSTQVAELLNRTNLQYVHLLGPRPPTHLDKRSGRGVSNRLKAFEWLREKYTNTAQRGVIYFADDDNSYDIRLFDEIRYTNKVSMFPVGLLAKLGLSTPILDKTSGKIIGFHDPFIGRRIFAVDMAGFAVNLQYFLSKPKATMPYKVGYEEDYFIKSLGVQISELEPKANNCTLILVWHTKTNSATLPTYANLKKEKRFNDTNLPVLYDNVIKST